MNNKQYEELLDYKVFCFNGKPKMIQVDFDRFTNHKRNLYTTKWKRIDGSLQYPSDLGKRIKKPDQLEEMLLLSKKLATASESPFVRVDFYIIKGKIYFGELTLYPGGGQEVFTPSSLDEKLGRLLSLEGVDNVRI